jgi:hypothetical protein
VSASALLLLAATAAGVGVVHTLLGPDHYLPFIVLGRARGWSFRRTATTTLACGLGHVSASLLLGLGGIALGLAVSRLDELQTVRGSLAAWALIALGTVYAAWGLHRALRGERHVHAPDATAAAGVLHAHPHHGHHSHAGEEHVHPHPGPRAGAPAAAREVASWRSLTPWLLFVVFVLGPCESLIPLVMVPAAAGSLVGVAAVSATFAAATLLTMVGAVAVGRLGVDLLPLGRLERYTHALAGVAILVSGLGIQLLGW